MSTNTATITWEDPPESATRGSRVPTGQVEAIASELRARPGEWARVLTFPDAQKQAYWFVRDVKAGSIRALKGAEVKARTIDGDGVVYARFLADTADAVGVTENGAEPAARQGLLPDLDTLVDAVLARLFERLASR